MGIGTPRRGFNVLVYNQQKRDREKKMARTIAPAVGQIWTDRTTTNPFFVRIESIDHTGNGWATVQPVEFDGTLYRAIRRKPREALLSTFDGRRGGFTFYMEAP